VAAAERIPAADSVAEEAVPIAVVAVDPTAAVAEVEVAARRTAGVRAARRGCTGVGRGCMLWTS